MYLITDRKLNCVQRPLGVSARPLIQFVLFTLISCPPNILWQEYLERKFPGYTYQAATGEQVLDRGNTARKLLFDQTLSAFVNTVAFIGAMSAFKGKSARAVQRDVEKVGSTEPSDNSRKKLICLQDVVPLMISGWKLWPLIAIINFVFVPVHRRVILSSVVGLFWGVYLSLFATLD